MFKGFNPYSLTQYPYGALYRVINHTIDTYNRSTDRQMDGQHMPFPFQLDQPIVNGKRFFEMVGYYKKLLKEGKDLKKTLPEHTKSRKLLTELESYDGHWRTGDKYVRNLFDNCILYYLDKFGKHDIDRAIIRFFVFAYSIRLNKYAVHTSSIDNKARGLERQASPFIHMKEVFESKNLINKIAYESVDPARNATVDLKNIYASYGAQ